MPSPTFSRSDRCRDSRGCGVHAARLCQQLNECIRNRDRPTLLAHSFEATGMERSLRRITGPSASICSRKGCASGIVRRLPSYALPTAVRRAQNRCCSRVLPLLRIPVRTEEFAERDQFLGLRRDRRPKPGRTCQRNRQHHQKHKCPGKSCYLLATPVHATKGARAGKTRRRFSSSECLIYAQMHVYLETICMFRSGVIVLPFDYLRR